MILGVLLHAGLPYATIPLGGVWPYKDIQAERPLFDYALVAIHAFRMPLFFLLAGFFARLLVQRRGIAGLLQNRFRRVLIPFVVGWSILYIPLILGFHYGNASHGAGRLIAAWGELRLQNTTLHLWFLNYLLWFYAATVVALRTLQPLLTRMQPPAQRWFRTLLGTPLRALVMAVPTACVLWFMQSGSFESSTRLVPSMHSLGSYSIFYLFGWMLYDQAHLLEAFSRSAGAQTVIGFLLVPITFHALLKAGLPPIARNTPEQLTAIITGALSVWLLIFGIIGLFVRYLREGNRVMNYLADASYWIYFAHLPVVVWLSVLLEDWGVSGFVKYPVVVSIAMVLLLVSYELLVPRTVLGKYIDGVASKRAAEARRPKAFAAAAGSSPRP